MKKIISSILVISILLGIIPRYSVEAHDSMESVDDSIFVYEENTKDELSAEEYETIKNIMSQILVSVKDEKECYGLENVDFLKVIVGNRIPSYEIVSGELKKTDIMIFPIIYNDKMLSQFLVFKDEEIDEWYVQLDSSLVEQTNKNIYDMHFCYLYDDEGVYAYSNEEIYLLGKEENQQETNVLKTRNNISQISPAVLENVSFLEAGKLFEFNEKDFDTNNMEVRSSVVPTLSKYLSVPIIKQPSGTSICWAIAMTSIINYVKGTNYSYSTVNTVCNGGVDEGANTNEVVTWLNTHYGMNYAKSGANPDPYTIVNELLSGYPSYARFTKTVDGITSGHAVVIRGCNTSNNTFSVMNPTPSTTGYTTGNILSGNVYRFVSAHSSYTYTLADRAYRYGL